MPFSVVPFSGDALSTAGDNLQLIYDSEVLIDAARPYGGIAATLQTTAFVAPQLFFGPIAPFSFNASTEYTLSFTLSARKNVTGFTGKMEVYFVGPAFPDRSEFGTLIETFELDDSLLYQAFGPQELNFTALATGRGYLRFVVYGAHWHVSDVSLKSASEFGFTPDAIELVLPVVGRKQENLEFQCELYDINNNLVPVTVESVPVFFDGGNVVIKGSGHRVDGELIVAPSGSSGATITTKGFYDRSGAFQAGSTAIYIGDGHYAASTTPFLAAVSPNGPVFSLSDRLTAENSGSQFVVTVSGTLLVQNRTTQVFEDVRNLLDLSNLFAIEAATNAWVSSSLDLAYSSSILTTTAQSTSASLAQILVSTSASLESTLISTSASLAQTTVATSASLAGGFTSVSSSLSTLIVNNSGSFGAQITAMSISLAGQEATDLISLTASIVNASSSLAAADRANSSSLAAAIIANSASTAQYIVATNIVDSVNKIRLPTSTKVQDGLYLESASMGFFNFSQSQYPVVINAAGQFRFADSASYVGGADPYTNVVGFANGAFLVRTPKLMLQTPGLQLIGNDTASISANVFKMGANAANLTFVSGAGFYGDGAGNVRFGTDTSGSEFFQYAPGVGLTIKAKRAILDMGGVYVTADTSSVSSGHQVKVGVNASGITFTSGAGFYVDGAGNLRSGDPAGNFLEYSPLNALRLVTQKMVLNAGGVYMLAHPASGSTNQLIVAVNAAGKTLASGSGFYVDGGGNFTVGDPANYVIEYLQSTGLRVNTQKLLLNAGGLQIVGHPTSASLNVIKLAPDATAMTMINNTGVIMDGGGNFRVGSDPSGSDYLSYTAGSYLVAKTRNMLLDGGGVYILGYSGSLGVSNVIKIGTLAGSMTLASGVGFYADGGGNFRVGDPATNFLEFTTTNALRITTQKLVLNAGGAYLLAHPASGSTNTFKLGTNASGITLTSGSGFYVAGDGSMRVGKTVGAGDYLLYDTTGLFVSASNFFLNAGSSGSALQVNQYNLVLGNTTTPGNWPFPSNGSTFKGFYVNNQGQFFVGSAYGNYIQFGGQVIELNSSQFLLNTPGYYFSSGVSGSFGMGSNPSAITFGSGVGTYLGGNGTFRAGNPAGQYIQWDGATLTVNGSITVIGGNAATQAYAISTAANAYSTASADTTARGLSSAGNYTGQIQGINSTVTQAKLNGMQLAPNPQMEDANLTRGPYVYNNLGNGAVVLSVVSAASVPGGLVPNSSGNALKIHTTAANNPGYGGFTFFLDDAVSRGIVQPTPAYYRRGSTIFYRIVAYIPVGSNIQFASNAFGSDGTFSWLTAQTGSGAWSTYVGKQGIGTSGSFASTGFFWIDTASPPFDWYVAVAEITDITSPSYDFNVVRGPTLPSVAPGSVSGLYMNSSYLGYWNGSTWNTYVGSDGSFQFLGNANNVISWNGSLFNVKAQNFTLKTTTVTVDSTVNNGTVALFNASSYAVGNGIWMDGNGNFRVGDPAGQRISYDSALLTVSASAFDLRSSNATISSVNGGVILLAGSGVTATHTFQGGSGAYDILSGSIGSVYFSLNAYQGGASTVAKFVGGTETDYFVAPSWYVRNGGGGLTNAWNLDINGNMSAPGGQSISTTGNMSFNTGSYHTTQLGLNGSMDWLRNGNPAFRITGSAALEAHFRPMHSGSRMILPVGANLYATI